MGRILVLTMMIVLVVVTAMIVGDGNPETCS